VTEFTCMVPKGYECSVYQVVKAVPTDWWQVFYIVTAFFAAAAALVLLVAFFVKKIEDM